MTTKNAIEAAKITKKLKNFTLDVENFAIPQGFATALIGENGAGKTTLLNLLGGMDNASAGNYFLAGRDVSKFNSRQLEDFRRNDIGFVFQFYNLMENLTAYENIALAASINSSSSSCASSNQLTIILLLALQGRSYAAGR